jgi:dephospho-CoA kinase
MIQRILWGLFFSGKDMVIADVPLLFEGGLAALFCVIVVITCTPEQELERFMARNPELSKEECETRIASQMPVEKKAKRANIVIDNSGDRASLVEQVEEARRQIMQRLYGFGLTLFQIVAIMGGAMPIALYFKIYQETRASGSDPVDLSSS